MHTRSAPEKRYETAVAETRQIALDDGSTLYLDAETRILATLSKTARRIELLDGQAYFDVASDLGRPFVVRTSGLTVTVTGTRFTVSSRGGHVAVAVESGSVEAAHDAALSRLSRGDRVSLRRPYRKAETASIDPNSVGSFRNSRILVENVPFDELIEQLDAYYDGDIWLSDSSLAETRISGSFDLDRPADALRAAARSQNARVRQVSSGVLAVVSR